MTRTSLYKDAVQTSFTEVFTFVLWLLVGGVGFLGFVLPYARPIQFFKKEVSIVAQTLEVELTTDPLPVPPANLPPLTQPPTLEAAAAPPVQAPALTAVAEPSVVAFALPVEGPVTIVEPKRAAYVAPAAPVEKAPVVAAPPPPTQLVYGEGEGRQPAPEYPFRARREGQEGTVKVRFTVGDNGQVLAAEVAAASPWVLLNQSAVKAVRERWRFRPGPMRLYEVAIRFELTR